MLQVSEVGQESGSDGRTRVSEQDPHDDHDEVGAERAVALVGVVPREDDDEGDDLREAGNAEEGEAETAEALCCDGRVSVLCL